MLTKKKKKSKKKTKRPNKNKNPSGTKKGKKSINFKVRLIITVNETEQLKNKGKTLYLKFNLYSHSYAFLNKLNQNFSIIIFDIKQSSPPPILYSDAARQFILLDPVNDLIKTMKHDLAQLQLQYFSFVGPKDQRYLLAIPGR